MTVNNNFKMHAINHQLMEEAEIENPIENLKEGLRQYHNFDPYLEGRVIKAVTTDLVICSESHLRYRMVQLVVSIYEMFKGDQYSTGILTSFLKGEKKASFNYPYDDNPNNTQLREMLGGVLLRQFGVTPKGSVLFFNSLRSPYIREIYSYSPNQASLLSMVEKKSIDIALDDIRTADVELSVGQDKRTIFAHRQILNRIPYFKALLDFNKGQEKIKLTEMDYETLKAFLELHYTGATSFLNDPNNAFDLYLLSHQMDSQYGMEVALELIQENDYDISELPEGLLETYPELEELFLIKGFGRINV